MKKIIFALAALALTACVRDNGNYDYTRLPEITATGINPDYRQVLPMDDVLTIDPVVEGGTNLEFEWVQITRTASGIELVKKTVGNERKLVLPVGSYGLGSYYLFLYVRNRDNGVEKHFRTTLEVQSEYSRGTWLLKESAGGNTDLDMLLDDGRMAPDIIADKFGAPLGGAPRSIGALYFYPMIDPATSQKVSAHSIGVVTQTGEVNILRASDMHRAFDHQTMFYEPQGEQPIKFLTSGGGQGLYLSNKGVGAVATTESATGNSSGIMGGISTTFSAGDHYAFFINANHLCWDATNDKLFFIDGSGNSTMSDLILGMTNPAWGNFSTMNSTCVYMGGLTQKGAVMVLRDKTTDALTIYSFDMNFLATAAAVPAGSKLNGATLITSSEMSVSKKVLWFVADNEIYEYDVTAGTETKLALDGMPTGEITCLRNYWYQMATPAFNQLFVATAEGASYNAAMWNIAADTPTGAPVRTVQGEGRIKNVLYMGVAYANVNFVMASLGFGPFVGYSR